MKILFFISLIIGFSSCITQKRCLQKFPPHITTKDSIVIKDSTIYRDTTITIPGDSVQIHDSIPCPDVLYHKEAKSKTGRTTAVIDINKGKLTVNCKTDSLQHRIDSLQTKIRSLEKYHTEVKMIPGAERIKYKVPLWCWVLLCANLIFIAWRLRKPFISLVKS